MTIKDIKVSDVIEKKYWLILEYNNKNPLSSKIKETKKMVRISDIHENKVLWDSVPYCDIPEEDISTYLLKNNDILFARTGGTVGKSFLVQNIKEDAILSFLSCHYAFLLSGIADIVLSPCF